MTLNDVMALTLRYFTKFGSFRAHCLKVVEDVVVKSSRSLSHLLISLLVLVIFNSYCDFVRTFWSRYWLFKF